MMFPIEMSHIAKIDSDITVKVFGYSARQVERDPHNLIDLSYTGPPTASDAGGRGPYC